MSPIEVIGWAAALAGLFFLAIAAHAAAGKLLRHARWAWVGVKAAQRFVRLGWNAGEPPDGAVILVANHCERERTDLDWSVLQRIGDRLYGRGYSMPLKNLHAWLEIDATKREDEGLDGQVRRAMESLPEGWQMDILIERGRANVRLISPEGVDDFDDWGAPLSKGIAGAVDHAMDASARSAA